MPIRLSRLADSKLTRVVSVPPTNISFPCPKISGSIVTKISSAIADGVRSPEVRSIFLAAGVDPVGSTPAEFGVFRQAEFAKLSKLVVVAGMKA